MDQLKPKLVLPFAPGFALLEDHNRWINEVKFDREQLTRYHEDNFGAHGDMRYIPIWPGDKMTGMEYHADSPYHAQLVNGGLYHLLDEVYPDEIKKANTIIPFDQAQLSALKKDCLHWMNYNAKLYAEEVLEDARFSIRFKDVPDLVWNIDRTAQGFELHEGDRPADNSRVNIITTARMLQHSLSHVWGGDALAGGYGLVVEMFDENALEKNLDIVCVRLITRYPMMREDILKQPIRAAKYFLTNPTIAGMHLKQKVALKPLVNRYPYNERDHWINTTKCALCKVCNIPEMEFMQLA